MLSVIPKVVICCSSPKEKDLTCTKYLPCAIYGLMCTHNNISNEESKPRRVWRTLLPDTIQRWQSHDSTPHLPALSSTLLLTISLNENEQDWNLTETDEENRELSRLKCPACLPKFLSYTSHKTLYKTEIYQTQWRHLIFSFSNIFHWVTRSILIF